MLSSTEDRAEEGTDIPSAPGSKEQLKNRQFNPADERAALNDPHRRQAQNQQGAPSKDPSGLQIPDGVPTGQPSDLSRGEGSWPRGPSGADILGDTGHHVSRHIRSSIMYERISSWWMVSTVLFVLASPFTLSAANRTAGASSMTVGGGESDCAASANAFRPQTPVWVSADAYGGTIARSHGWDRTPIAHLKESYSDLHVVHKAIEIVEQNQILVDAVRENGQVSPCRRLRNSTLTLDLACEQF